jgi:hypothetical protein
MIKWFFKWAFRLFLVAAGLGIGAAIVFLLTYNAILRNAAQHQIRAQTGMDAEIRSFKLAILAPTMEIQNAKIYNSSAFGGSPFLDIPEIHIEYDRAAFLKKEVHITLMRFNLAELDIVKNQAGQTNIFAFGTKLPVKKSRDATTVNFKQQTGYDFKGIDTLNISIGKVKFIDLTDSRNNREQTIGIDNLVMQNVKSPNDLIGLAVLVDLRSNHFFDSMIGLKNFKSGNSPALQNVLDIFGIAF